MAYDNIAQMMQAYAEQAVSAAREMNITRLSRGEHRAARKHPEPAL